MNKKTLSFTVNLDQYFKYDQINIIIIKLINYKGRELIIKEEEGFQIVFDFISCKACYILLTINNWYGLEIK